MAATDRISATEQLADGFAFLESPRWHEGRLWAVDLYAQQVLCFDRDVKVETRLAVPGTPTGLGWLPDGRMLIVAETFGRRLTAFDVASDATLSHRRIFADNARELFGL